MCGIAGIMPINKRALTEKELKLFIATVINTQHRGHDATGFAGITTNGNLISYKLPKMAVEFFNLKSTKTLLYNNSFTSLIAHVRATTHGSEHTKHKVNKKTIYGNNHPVLSIDNTLALVHNGMCNNYKELIEKLKLKRLYEVDTEALIRTIEFYMKSSETKVDAIKKLFDVANGGYTCALLDKNDESITLFRNTNPLSIAHIKDLDCIIFNSEDRVINQTFVRKVREDMLIKHVSLFNYAMVTINTNGKIISLKHDENDILNIKMDETNIYNNNNSYGTYDYSKTGTKNSNLKVIGKEEPNDTDINLMDGKVLQVDMLNSKIIVIK